MDKQTITKGVKGIQRALRKHSPEILTGIGIAGMIAATITAVRATPKALRMIDEREIKDGKRLNTKEIGPDYLEVLCAGGSDRGIIRSVPHWSKLGQRQTQCGAGDRLHHLGDSPQGIPGEGGRGRRA